MRARDLVIALALVGTSGTLSGCATCFWGAMATLTEQGGADEELLLEEENAGLAYPGRPWVQMPKKRNDAMKVQFFRLDPVVSFYVLAERTNDGTTTNEALAEASINNLSEAGEDPRVGDRAPMSYGGLDGLTFESDVVIEDTKHRYRHWVAAHNGFLYQLVVSSPEASEEELRTISEELFARFRVLDLERASELIEIERFTRYDAGARGFELDLGKERFSTWNDYEAFPLAEVAGTRFNTQTFFAVSPVLSRAGRPSPPALAHAALAILDLEYPDPDLRRLGSREEGEVLVEEYGLVKDNEGQRFDVRFVVRSGPEGAVLLAVWGVGGEEEIEDATRVLTAALSHRAPQERPPLDERQRAVQAGLHYSIGGYYEGASQYRQALRFFQAASELEPENASYALGVLSAFNRSVMHAEAYAYYEAMPKELRELPVMQTWAAWHLKEGGRRDEAVALYDELFATDLRGDDDFVAYVGLLADVGRWDDAKRAYAAYLERFPSRDLYLALARALNAHDKPDEAIAVLEGAQQRLGLSPAISFAKMRALEARGRFQTIDELCDELIAGGFSSADVYLWQGRARYEQKLYRQARESYEKVLTLRPEDTIAKEWVAELSSLLGESGDLDLKVPLSPVPLPPEVAKALEQAEGEEAPADRGAYYLGRVLAMDLRDQTLRRTHYRRIRVVDERGNDELSTLTFDFEPPHERIFVNRLEVRGADGKLIKRGKPDDYYVIHNREGSQASSRRTLHVPVPKLARGNTLDLVVTLTEGVGKDRVPYLKHRLASSRPMAISAVSLTGDLKRLSSRARHLGAPKRLEGGGYLWLLRQPPSYQWEPLEGPWEEELPYVVIGDKQASWRSVAQRYAKEIEPHLEEDAEVRRIAERVTAGAKSDDEKVAALWRYVQGQVSYQALEFGVRGTRPNTPATTLEQGYGDCKDHAVLLHGLLRAVGISSSLALIHTRRPLEEKVPSLSQFNHMILFVPGKGGGRFIDATDKEFDVQMQLPVGLAGRQALLLGPSPRLVRLPKLRERLEIEVVRKVRVERGRGYAVSEEAVFRGYAANFMRAGLKSVDTAGQKSWVQDLVSAELPAADVESVRVENLLDNAAPLVVSINYTTKAGVFERGDELILSPPALWERYYLSLRAPGERKKPFTLRYALGLKSTTTLEGGAGVRLLVDDERRSGRAAPFRWRHSARRDGERVTAELQCDIAAGSYGAAELARYRQALDDALEASSRSLRARLSGEDS